MILVVVAVLAVAVTLLMWSLGGSNRRSGWARPLQWAPPLAAVVAAVAVWPTTWPDSGAFALLLLGVPVVLAAAPLGMPEQARWRRAGVWLVALLQLGWALLLGLGVGLLFVPAALLLVAAAATVPNADLTKKSGLDQGSVRPAR